MAIKKNEIYFTTGCKLIDMVLGGDKGVYGCPAGKFLNIVGDSSTGKTFLSNEIIASAYYKYGPKKFKWVYDDCESGYSFANCKEMYGFDIYDWENPVKSKNVEEAFCRISNFANKLKEGQFGIYVLDSLDGLTSKEQDKIAKDRLNAFNKDKEYEVGSYNMGKQKFLSNTFFPQLCKLIEDKNVLVIIVSQVREKIADLFSFEKYQRNGGKALDFYCDKVLWLASMKKIKKNDIPVSVVVKAKTTKNKVPRPFRTCTFSFIYDYGLDDIGSNIDYLFDLRTKTGELSAQAKNVRWKDGEKIGVNPLKSWLKESELLDAFQDSEFYTGKVTVEDVLDWVNSNAEIKAKFDEKFGSSMSREELIRYIEDNNLQEELLARVEAKWEENEAKISSGRKKKYACQPVGSDD